MNKTNAPESIDLEAMAQVTGAGDACWPTNLPKMVGDNFVNGWVAAKQCEKVGRLSLMFSGRDFREGYKYGSMTYPK